MTTASLAVAMPGLKRGLTLAVVLGLLAGSPRMAAQVPVTACLAPPADSLVARWNAEGTAVDSVGGFNGVARGGVSYGTGVHGQAFVFDGATGAVEVVAANDNLLYPGTGSFSIGAWIRSSNASQLQTIVSKYECGGGACGGDPMYEFYLGSGRLRASLRDVDGHATALAGVRVVADGQFHHVALVRDIAASEARLYVDGTLDAAASLAGGASGAIRDNDGEADPFIIGAFRSYGAAHANTDFFDGSIDDVVFYNRVIGDADAGLLSGIACGTPGNQPPSAAADTAVTVMPAAIDIDVLANDSDADGDPLGVTSVTQGKNGATVTVTSGNIIHYAPSFAFHGIDTFSYTLSDGRGGVAAARVTIAVNVQLPVDVGVTDLGVPVGNLGYWSIAATGVNDSGQVVGRVNHVILADGSYNTSHSFLYSSGVMTDIGDVATNDNSANAINNAGQIAGQSAPQNFRAWVRNPDGVFRYYYAPRGGYNFGNALAINSAGAVGGSSASGEYFGGGSYGAIGSPGGGTWTQITALVPNAAGPYGANVSVTGINDSGAFVGPLNNGHAFLYAGGVTDLGTLGGSSSLAFGLNNSNMVVGHADTADGYVRAFSYSPGGGMVDIGLPGAYSHALAVSDTGVIIGYGTFAGTPGERAFLYTPSAGMQDLNVLYPMSGWTLQRATAISRDGRYVAGYGISPSGATHAFRITLTPDGTPVTALPIVSIGNVTKAEGTGGTTPFLFPVTLSSASALPVTVDYGTAAGTASVGDFDYFYTNGTLTFAPGETAKTVTVDVVGDSRVEPDESFAVILSTPTNATLDAPGIGVGTIVNDDVLPNAAPAAVDDAVTAFVNKPIDIDVLANDSDADHDMLSLTAVTPGVHDDVSIADGVIHYVPEFGFSGIDTFTYTVSDGRGGTATATVTVDVKGPVVIEITETVHVHDDLILPPMANAGPDQIVEATSAAGATVLLDGSASYSPSGGPLTYTWTGAFGGPGVFTTATGVRPVVTLPIGTNYVELVVSDGQYQTVSDTTVVVRDTTPPELAQLTNVGVSTAAPTAVVMFAPLASDAVSSPGSITVGCTPASGSVFPLGTTVVSCTARDQADNVSAPMTFDVVVQPFAPGYTAAGSDVSVTPVDPSTGLTPVSIVFSSVVLPGVTGVTTSRMGPAPPTGFKLGSPSTFFDITTTAVFAGPATVCFDLTGVTFKNTLLAVMHFENGVWVNRTASVDLVHHRACATVTSFSPFVVLEAALPPVANAGPNQTVEATSHAGAAVVLDGSASTDPYGVPLSYTWTGPFGTRSAVTTTVTLPLGINTVTLTVDDGDGGTAASPVTITVQDTTPPELRPLSNLSTSTAASSAVVTFAPSASDAVSAQVDINVSCSPASGSAFALGVTTVRCTARDEAGNISAPVTFVVFVNGMPSAEPDAASTLENVAVTIPVLLNDSDVDGDALALVSAAAPAHGSAAVTAGSVVYTPAANFAGDDAFAYTVSDTHGATATGMVHVAVSRLGRFTVLSRDLTWLSSGVRVASGDVGAIEPKAHGHADRDGDDGDRDDVTVRVGSGARVEDPSSRVVGDTVMLLNKSSVASLIANVLIAPKSSMVLGTNTSPMSVPFVALPALPPIQPGTASVTVGKKKTLSLAAGAYGVVHVGAGATLTLTGGLYQLQSIVIDQSSTVVFQAATELRVRTQLDSAAKAKWILDPAVPSLKASQVLIYVAGKDEDRRRLDPDDDDDAGPVSVQIGMQNIVQANIYAANGTVWLKSGTQATGAFIGVHVRVGANAVLRRDSAFR